MGVAIRVEGVSKQYRLGEIGTGTLSHDLNRWWARVRGREDPYAKVGEINDRAQKATSNYVWALRDINLEVQQGEVLGIIGRNGAGKSTLLKLLSRVTAPTTGTIKAKGRISSLLEVGTGFHPEMTGRENVYMNGAILGMRRREIDAELDSIVDFSGCAKYLDTPVKRYSSGMLVRLGFAVAAHLRCDILIVDEVLAVGDAEFQKKCIGMMQDVSASGRTVLFVSHNLSSIRNLCARAIEIGRGCVVMQGPAGRVISDYLANLGGGGSRSQSWDPHDAPGKGGVSLRGLRVLGGGNENGGFRSSDGVIIQMELEIAVVSDLLCVGFDLVDDQGVVVFRSYQTDQARHKWPQLRSGLNRLRCTVPAGLLNSGTYTVAPRIGLHNVDWLVHLDAGLVFEIERDHSASPLWSTGSRRPGSIAPVLVWTARS